MENKKKFQMPSAYSILILIIIALAIITHLVPGDSVTGAALADVVMAPTRGFIDAIDVCVFVLVLGGFLGTMTKTGALDNGIAAIVKKLKGNELMLIPVLMTVFSLGGTSYGMAEETMAFYALLVGTMMAAGFDAIVGAAIILLGAGVGVLGSTVNPFAIAAAVDALQGTYPDIHVNQTIVIALGAILWLSSLIIAIIFVMRYAKKVKADSGKSLLTAVERAAAQEAHGNKDIDGVETLTGKQKACLWVFAVAFIIMIISLIPWESFGITIFNGWSEFLNGTSLGNWYFQELQAWFLIMSIIIALIAGIPEREFVNTFVAGAADMVGVVLVIAVSRGISVIMTSTGLGDYILANAANALSGVNSSLFTVGSYVIYLGLSFLIPSTSGLAAASMPTFGGLAHQLGLSPEVMILIFSAACGVINLVTPTSGVVMGGLAIAKIEWPTWVKFVAKLLGILIVVNIIILSVAMMIL